MSTIRDLLKSKKAVVFLTTTVVLALATFGGFDPAAAEEFTTKLYALAMAYLGGQGLADLGRYAGEAYASGKAMVATRDPNQAPRVEASRDGAE